jgi:hypothetical protein
MDFGTEFREVYCLVLEFAKHGSLEGYYKDYKLNKENYKNGKVINEEDLKDKIKMK